MSVPLNMKVLGVNAKDVRFHSYLSLKSKKRQFESLGRFPFWVPGLCASCQSEWEKIGPKLKHFEAVWQNKKMKASDHDALKDWLKLIEQSTSYRKKDYGFRANMIRKLLSN